jgi:(1->4)-alpha-D-glucan 1-alpha-D-glucosylmutase
VTPKSPSAPALPTASLPTATYRLQFNAAFPFAAAEKIAPYLRDLGVSHVYASPILTARAGSMHGYDVVDFSRINPELGGEVGFERLAEVLHAQGIGIILDIVPNHMAVGGADNPYWLDVLEKGRDSPYAKIFDIDFDRPEPELNGKVLAPFLGSSYRDVLASGDLHLTRLASGKYVVTYCQHCFPLCEADQLEIAEAGEGAYADPALLHNLLERQHFRLAWWRVAGDEVNYRRFFDITELAGVRIENPPAFDLLHKIPLDLYARGMIDGLRIDHIDGLTDPAGYSRTLRQRLEELQPQRQSDRAQQAYLVVEKILAADEDLPAEWPVEGTTGYDFMNEVSALQHATEGAAPLGAFWHAVSGRPCDFDAEENLARHEMMHVNFCGQREMVVDALFGLAPSMSGDRDLTRSAIRRAVAAIVSNMRVYRSYALGGAKSPGAGRFFEAAVAAALRDPAPEEKAMAFICDVMNSRSDDPGLARAIRCFNQLTAPVAAKAVEDTAFYRYGVLLSRNDVGFDAGRLALPVQDFHARMARRAQRLPRSMVATATHDHKRGEDLRARLAVLSEIPELWIKTCHDFFALNDAVRPPAANRSDEYQLYQMIIGAWPLALRPDDSEGLAQFAERLSAWRVKSLREAKLRSTWLAPQAENEKTALALLAAVLDPARSQKFLLAAAAFVGLIEASGVMNGLAQMALRCLAPGVPDLYQGTEFWDFSLVDPDNRRPVDFAARVKTLAAGGSLESLAADWRRGAVKQGLLARLLHLRRDRFELFAEGDYRPLAVEGEAKAHVLAFSRRTGREEMVVAVTLHCAEALLGQERLNPPGAFWGETAILCGETMIGAENVLGGPAIAGPRILAAKAFATLPVAVWFRGDPA